MRGGQITIKIQPTSASLPPHPHPLPAFNQKQVVQLPPQYIQNIPNGHQVRVIQQMPQQVFIVPQSAPFPGGQNIMVQSPGGQSAVLQPAPPPSQQIRGQSFVSAATPVNVQQYRAI